MLFVAMFIVRPCISDMEKSVHHLEIFIKTWDIITT